jgi:hypothetical protein
MRGTHARAWGGGMKTAYILMGKPEGNRRLGDVRSKGE